MGKLGKKVFYEGIDDGQDIIEEIYRKTGIDIKDDPEYSIEFHEGATDGEGVADNVWTEYKVIYTPIEMKPIEEELPIPEISDEESVKKEKIQDMLDKYWGNRKKEKEYKRAMKRYKSHIKEDTYTFEDENGIKREGKYKTVEIYPGIEDDEEFLQLEEFRVRLERISKYKNGDLTGYENLARRMVYSKQQRLEAIAQNSEDIMERRKAEQDLKESEQNMDEEIIQAIDSLMQSDVSYITTNNYAYNQHRNTSLNLPTLGKHGEYVDYAPITRAKRDEKGNVTKKLTRKQIAGNIAKGIYNGGIAVRNNVRVPVYRFAGKYIITPAHKLLFDPEKKVSGLYKSKATHRYTARRDMYTKDYLEDIDKRNAKLRDAGKDEIRPSKLKLVFGVRAKAIFEAKQGNIMVLNDQAAAVEESAREVVSSKRTIRNLELLYKKREDRLFDRKNNLVSMRRKTESEQEKAAIDEEIGKIDCQIVKFNSQKEQRIKDATKGLTQTDPVTMAQHDMANKANITRVVTGISTAARMAGSHFIGQNLKKWISERITKKVDHPQQVVQEAVTVPGKIDKESLENITFKDLLDNSTGEEITYDALGGNAIKKPDIIHVRGLTQKTTEGLISGSDGNGFSIIGRTDVKISPIDKNSSVFDSLAELYTKTGNPTTKQEIFDRIIKSTNSGKTLEAELPKDLWLSDKATGMSSGWLRLEEANKKVVEIITGPQTKVVDKVIPGYSETVVTDVAKQVLNGRAIAMEGALALGQMADIYEILRETKSQERMEEERKQSQSKGKVTKATKIDPNQKDNHKGRSDHRYNDKFGFAGTRKGDFASKYDEGPWRRDIFDAGHIGDEESEAVMRKYDKERKEKEEGYEI